MLAAATIAIVLHAMILNKDIISGNAFNLAFTNMVSLVAWVIAVLFLVAIVNKPAVNLGAIVMPLGALTVGTRWIWPGSHLLSPETSSLQVTHIIISLIAYSLLSLAAVQSIVLLFQESRLHQKQPGHFIRALPPIETMETLMLHMVVVGFVLLTATIVSGIFFSEETFGQPFRLNHHVVLSLAAWIVYAIFLFGHWRFGWRGRTAVKWVFGGGVLLALGYFGTKFIIEIVLKR